MMGYEILHGRPPKKVSERLNPEEISPASLMTNVRIMILPEFYGDALCGRSSLYGHWPSQSESADPFWRVS